VRVGGGLAEEHDLKGGAAIHAAGDVGVVEKRLYLARIDAHVQDARGGLVNPQRDRLGL